MAELVVEAENSGYVDGYEWRYYPTIDLYPVVHDAALASVVTNNNVVYVGQQFDFWGYNYYLFIVDRGTLVFDTSALPGRATIISAALSLFGREDVSHTDFDITLVSGEDLADIFVDADYGELLARVTPMGTLLNSSTYSADYNNEITLNALGLAAISKTGNTRFALRSSRDISVTSPASDPPLSVERLRPNAVGDEDNLDAHPGTGEDNYEDVNEVTSDEDTTYVSGPVGGARDLYNIANHVVGSGTIYAVRVHAVCKTAGSGYCRLYVKSGATIDFENTNHYLEPSYTEEVQEWEDNPDTSNPWTWAEVDGLQAGLRLLEDARCTQLWIEVLYGPPGYDNYDYEYIGYWGSNTAGKKPKLTITYVLDLPTGTTDPATSLEKTASTLNGTLDDDGGEACDCGFEYGETTAYGTTTPTESKETGETFSQAISGLTPGKHYHFRALVTNSAGTSYGSDRQFFAERKGGNPNIDQVIYQHVERIDR